MTLYEKKGTKTKNITITKQTKTGGGENVHQLNVITVGDFLIIKLAVVNILTETNLKDMAKARQNFRTTNCLYSVNSTNV